MADRTYLKGGRKLTGEETDLASQVDFAFMDNGLSAPMIENDMKMLLQSLLDSGKGSTLATSEAPNVDEQFFKDRLQKASPNVKQDFGDLAKRMYQIYQQQRKQKAATGTGSTLATGAAL